MLDAAEAHLEAGRVAEAIDAFRALLSANPDNGFLRARVAEAYRRAGNLERAFHHFQKAATLFIRASDLPTAIKMFEAANYISPNEPEVLFRWAECLEQLGRFEALQPILRQLVEAAGASGDRRRVWALERLVALAPDDIELSVARASALGEAGRIIEAADAWRRLSPTLGQSRQDWVSMIIRAGQRAMNRADIGTTLAHVLMANRRHRDALTLLIPFYDDYSDHVDVLKTVVEALEGVEAWDKALTARLELLAAMDKRRLRGPALEMVAQLLRSHPTAPEVLRLCANTCQSFGLTGEASRLRFQLCQLHERRAEPEARDRVLSALLRDDPRHEGGLAMAIAVLTAAGRADEAVMLSHQLADVRGLGAADLPDVEVVEALAEPVAPTKPMTPRTMTPVDPTHRGESEYAWDDASALSLGDDDVLFSRTDQESRPAEVPSPPPDESHETRPESLSPPARPAPVSAAWPDDNATLTPSSVAPPTSHLGASPVHLDPMGHHPIALDASPTVNIPRASRLPPLDDAHDTDSEGLFIDERPTRIDMKPFGTATPALRSARSKNGIG